jgi:hypothetical protein
MAKKPTVQAHYKHITNKTDILYPYLSENLGERRGWS